MSNKPKSKRRGRLILIIGLVLILGAAGGWTAYKRREKPIIIQTEKVSRRDLTEIVVANGRIQPVVQVVIQPEVSGEIIELPVKEGQSVQSGDLLVKIKPDNYIASRNSAEAHYKSALAGKSLAKANLDKAEFEFARVNQLYQNKLVSESAFLEAKTTLEVARASHETSSHQADQAKAALARVEDDLAKTTIKSPIAGTVTKLRSQRGERVVGTAMMAGTEIMTVANLNEMEARVDIGEMDVVLIKTGQKARLEVEAFRDKKFNGIVTEIGNAAKGPPGQQQSFGPQQQQEATKFEVRILLQEKEPFRPGMSVTAEIETRSRTNVLCVPIMAVTTRMPKGAEPPKEEKEKKTEQSLPLAKSAKKEEPKPNEVVFLLNSDTAKMAVVKTGISDDSHIEVTEGLSEGQEIISGGYAAISRELEEGKKVKRGSPESAKKKPEANRS